MVRAPGVMTRAMPPDAIVEGRLQRLGIVDALALDAGFFERGCYLRAAGLFGQHLYLAGFLQQHGGHHRLLDRAAGGDDAMVAQQQRVVAGEAGRDRLAKIRGDDEIAGAVEHRQPVAEHRTLVTDREQRAAERAEGDGVRRMGVDDRFHLWTCAHDLGVDEHFDMARSCAAGAFAVQVDRDHVVTAQFLEPDAGGLHQQPVGAGRVAHGHVSPDQVALPIIGQDVAPLDQLVGNAVAHAGALDLRSLIPEIMRGSLA